jgi:hypothetical protein
MHRKTHHKNEKKKLTDQTFHVPFWFVALFMLFNKELVKIIFIANETNKNIHEITTKENEHRNLLNVPMVFRELIL